MTQIVLRQNYKKVTGIDDSGHLIGCGGSQHRIPQTRAADVIQLFMVCHPLKRKNESLKIAFRESIL
jgi:hypothetical protein